MDYSVDPLRDGLSKVELIDSMGTDESIVRAARVSYAKDANPRGHRNKLREFFKLPSTKRRERDEQAAKDAKLIDFLVRNRHTSPLEHTYLTFHIKCPLFVRSQWHRHRMWSYNEVSRRYTSEELEFYVPPSTAWRKQNKTGNKQGSEEGDIESIVRHYYTLRANDIARDTLQLYNQMVEDGVAREQARMILPQNLYTRFYASANLHSVAHFVNLRSDPHAQWEIRVFSNAIDEMMRERFPVTWRAVEEHWLQ